MALTTVVTDRFFERLLPVLRELDEDAQSGPLTLALLVPFEDGGFRSLVLSSPKLDGMGLGQATSLVLERLRKGLGPDWLKINSVSIQQGDSIAVDALRKFFDIPQLGTVYRAIGSPLVGLDDPILFLSRKLAKAA